MPAISIDGVRIASVKQPHLIHDSVRAGWVGRADSVRAGWVGRADSVRAGWVGRVDSLLSCYRGSDSNVCVCTMQCMNCLSRCQNSRECLAVRPYGCSWNQPYYLQ